eukprot:628245-Hanusia_phi.AAC.1
MANKCGRKTSWAWIWRCGDMRMKGYVKIRGFKDMMTWRLINGVEGQHDDSDLAERGETLCRRSNLESFLPDCPFSWFESLR